MLTDFGMVKPGTTLYVPFHTFDSNDPSASVTITGLAVTDVEIYKNGSVTQRASDTGYALLDTDGIDFDGITGIHGFSIDLSSNATADFFTAGAQYWVVVSAITVDGATINFIAATFSIGYRDAILNTTIATLASQTSFTLTAGPAEDNALVGCPVLVHDIASAVQVAVGYVSAYTGSTKTVTLAADPAIFTMAAGDNISVFMPSNVRAVASLVTNGTNLGTACANYSATRGLTGTAVPAAASNAAGGLPISAAGGLDLDAKLANTNEVTAARMGALTDWIDGGRLDLILDARASQTSVDDVPTVAEFNARTLVSAGYASPTNITAGTITTVTNLTNAPTAGDLTATMKASVNAEADTALADYDAPTRAELTTDINSVIAYLDGWVIAKGTIGATGNTTTTLHLTGLTYGDNEISNYLIAIKDVSAGEWHARYIEGWADTGDLATVATLPFTPEASVDLYAVLAFRQDVTGGAGLDAAGVRAAVGLAAANLDTQLADIPTVAEFEARTLVAAAYFDPAADAVANVTLVATTTNLTNLPAITANWLTAAGTAADFGTEVGTAVWATTTRELTGAANITSTGGTTVPQTGDSFARLGAAGAGLTDLGGMSTTMKAQVESEVGDALAAYHVVMVKTTIATLASQTSFTLTAGSADNDAYNGCEIVIEDAVTAAQKATGVVDDYTGATKTVTLRTDPAVFTMAASDIVTITRSRSLKSTVDNRTLDVTTGGAAGVDWANVETPGSMVNLSATTVNLVNTLTTYTGNTVQTGDSFARLGAPAGASVSADIADLPTVADFEARTLVAASYFDPAADAVANVTLVGTLTTYTGNTPQTGDVFPLASTEIAQILALLDDPRTEPGQGAPPVNPDLATKIDYLYKAWRNKKTQTATTRSLYDDAGTTVDQKATDSDDGTTFTKGELATGP